MRCKSIALAVLALLLLSTAAFASSTFVPRGTAVIPGVEAASSSTVTNSAKSIFYLTNISGSDVTVRATFYDHDGNEVPQLWNVYTGNDFVNAPVLVTTSNTFDLAAAATRWIRPWADNMDRVIYGHVVLEWSSEDTMLRKAIMAIGKRHRQNSNGSYESTFTINGDMPF